MKNYQLLRFFKITSGKYILPGLLAICSMGMMGLHAQTSSEQHPGIKVMVDWHTVAEPGYGASYQYAWNNLHVHSKAGIEIRTNLEFQITKDEGGGLFTLLSKPIAVPSSGMLITFDRQIVMHPTDAERGTLLPNDPKDKCKNQAMGVSRALFHQVIDVIDAQTGKVLGSHVDEYKFEIARYQIMNDVDNNGHITLDLSSYAGHQVKIRTWILASYNGRGPSKATTPNLSPVSSITQQDLK